jgi:hypothetical protein
MIGTGLLLIAIVLCLTLAFLAARISARRAPPTERHPVLRRLGCLFLAGITCLLLAGVALGPSGHPPDFYVKIQLTGAPHTLALAMFQYANDNNGEYPHGTSSTEVFQQLMDGGYVDDPAIFYLPMSGKTRAEKGAKLRPENVCYDVTSGIDSNSPVCLPLVFLTGFRIEYKPNGTAVSLVKPFPKFDPSPSSWMPHAWLPFPGFAMADLDNMVFFKENANRSSFKLNADGFAVVPDVIPDVTPLFDPRKETYRQLTPEGPLK